MRIAHLTAGTGNFHCGNCHRDNTLVKGLVRLGHDACLVPLYLPLVLEDDPAPQAPSLFAGGANMFLQQKFGIFRHTPAVIDRWLDNSGLLRWVSRFAGMTRARDLGEMTVQTFRPLGGHQVKEWNRLLDWLADWKPDVVAFSNGLLTGLARGVKERLGCTTVCSLQGEDGFLDSLPEPYRSEAWNRFREALAHVDALIGVSDYYSALMSERIGISRDRIVTVYNGIEVGEFPPPVDPPRVPTIGFLARLCPSKGLDTLVQAFIALRKSNRVPGAQLRLAGAKTGADEQFVREQERALSEAGLLGDTLIQPNLDLAEKLAFLQSASVVSVPATYGEAFGLFVIEALACGVPVVQPAHGAFPELIDATGGGILCAPDDPLALAAALESLLADPARAADLGRRGRASVIEKFSSDTMARRFAEVCEQATPSPAPAA